MTTVVKVQVELFGTARIAAGRGKVELAVPAAVDARDLASALAHACPELVGKAILEDGSGLQSSYTFNLNGTSFLADGEVQLRPGDTLLLFSSQAGG